VVEMRRMFDGIPYLDLSWGKSFGDSLETFSHSTVTLLARLRGLSTSQPRRTAMW
jgi:hypothetical protein